MRLRQPLVTYSSINSRERLVIAGRSLYVRVTSHELPKLPKRARCAWQRLVQYVAWHYQLLHCCVVCKEEGCVRMLRFRHFAPGTLFPKRRLCDNIHKLWEGPLRHNEPHTLNRLQDRNAFSCFHTLSQNRSYLEPRVPRRRTLACRAERDFTGAAFLSDSFAIRCESALNPEPPKIYAGHSPFVRSIALNE